MASKINIRRTLNKFYRNLKLDKETKKAIKFFRQIKEQMLKEDDKK